MTKHDEGFLQNAGVKPKSRYKTEWGDVLIGERVKPGSMGTTAETYWFWRQGDSPAVGRPIEFPMWTPEGVLIPYEERERLALMDAERTIPTLAKGAEAHREARAKEIDAALKGDLHQ